MKNIFIICLLILPAIVSAQSLLRPRRGLHQQQSQLLEPLLPFSVAVEKAKANDPRGWYALAIHYTKGDEVKYDRNNARKFLQKAYDLNYSNAVFVATLLKEKMTPSSGFSRIGLVANLRKYTDLTPFVLDSEIKLSLTNAADVAMIRDGYERAFKLGVSAATNELARFEQRVKEEHIRIKGAMEKSTLQKSNSELASSALGIALPKPHESTEALRKRLNDPDADTDDGRTFIWEAGGKDGLSLDVLIRVKQNEGWHYIEKATITIDKDGKIIKVQGKPGVTEIQS